MMKGALTMQKIKIRGMGWLPDYPDFRDYTMEKDSIKEMLKKIGLSRPSRPGLSAAVDFRQWCSPIEDQGDLGSCTAHAGVGAVEYFEKRAFGKYIDASRLFLYKTTRNLMNIRGDTGAYLRSTMGALVLFGVPPEEYWPYSIADFDDEPDAFLYALAQNYQTISYYRLDPPGTSGNALLDRIKTSLAAGLPAIFGFTVYSSIDQADANGLIPYPGPEEEVLGGHAIVAVGYDDKIKIQNAYPKGKQTKGALLIRNSWGMGWGEKGYGWLPYEYVLSGLADDWWSLLKNEWVDTGAFKL
jgi:C1A family cysteine protease